MPAPPLIDLNDGHAIPQLGFGVFQIPPAETATAVVAALEVGYRHIDTAEMYGNEREVGEGIRRSGVDRADVYVTSKLNNNRHRPGDARAAFDRTLADLGCEYVDLFLIHWPLPTRYDGDYVATWKALEEFSRDGRARSIGVSNFQPAHLERLAAECELVPAVNQIELHPYFQNREVRSYGGPRHRHRGVVTDRARGRAGRPGGGCHRRSGGPLARPGRAALAHPARQRGLSQIDPPRADQQNFELFDFALEQGDVATSIRSIGGRTRAAAPIRTRWIGSPPDRYGGGSLGSSTIVTLTLPGRSSAMATVGLG